MCTKFFPLNCTSLLFSRLENNQITQNAFYRKQLVRKALFSLDFDKLQDPWKIKINVLDALHLISLVWDSVDENCISNAFLKRIFSKSDINDEEWLEEFAIKDYTKEDEFILPHINTDEYIYWIKMLLLPRTFRLYQIWFCNMKIRMKLIKIQ